MAKHEGEGPVWKVNQDGSAYRCWPADMMTPDVQNAMEWEGEKSDNLGDVLTAIELMARDLNNAVHCIPDVMDSEMRVMPKRFDARTRLAFIACGNALDYALRLVNDLGRDARIKKLRRELADEMKAAGIEGDPGE